jgi:hypothetical protein
MNSLEQWIAAQNVITEKVVMNLLQDEGIVSDNCVWAKDVCESDCVQAVAWLEGRRD